MHSVLFPILNHVDDFICITDEHCTIINSNNTFKNILGYRDSDIAGKKITDLMHPADRHRYVETVKAIASDEAGTGTIETQIKARDGRFITVKWLINFDFIGKAFYSLGDFRQKTSTEAGPEPIQDSIQNIIQSFPEGFVVIDSKWRIQSFNPAFQAMCGLSAAQLSNTDIRQLSEICISTEAESAFNYGFKQGVHVQVQYHEEKKGRWFRVNVYPQQDKLYVFFRDITNLRIPQLILALEKKVLELNAMRPDDLPHTVNIFLEGIETIFPEMVCTLLEVDENQQRVHYLAAPGMPDAFKEGIENLIIGPNEGTCGSAIYHRTQVVDVDIATSPSWEKYRHLALPYGLKACWSIPVLSSNSNLVLASFGIYFRQTREPKPDEVHIIERTVNIIRVLIESKRNIERLNGQNHRLQEIASISSHQLRRPVATILGLVNLFDTGNPENAINHDIIAHLKVTAAELDEVIHNIVKKTLEI